MACQRADRHGHPGAGTASAADELKERYLAPALARRDGGRHRGDRARRRQRRGRSIRTRAVRDGDEWVINGTKLYITNGTQADWLCLLARTSDEGGHRGMSQIVVPTDTPGFSVSRKLDKLGQAVVGHRRAVASSTCGCRWPTPSARSAAASSSRWPSSRTSG